MEPDPARRPQIRTADASGRSARAWMGLQYGRCVVWRYPLLSPSDPRFHSLYVHGAGRTPFLFYDGHVESLTFTQTFLPRVRWWSTRPPPLASRLLGHLVQAGIITPGDLARLAPGATGDVTSLWPTHSWGSGGPPE